MKTSIIQSLFCLLLSVSLTTWVPGLRGEDAAVESDERDDVAEALLTDEELDKLTGPIALYPDALVALILPASTEVADVVMAARFFARGGKESEVASQPWDESVRALARYSEVILWMDENLAWTRQLGAAFLTQPADVMQAVQRMRAKAKAAGNLESNQEQTVIEEPNYIRIVPTQPEVIYVPRYNPEIVYVPVTTYYGPVIAYGAPYPCGAWLRYDCNWLSWSIWLGTWNFAYYRQPAWCPPRGGGHWSPPPPHHTWRPPPGKRPPSRMYPPRHDNRWTARPVPMHGAPGRAAHFARPGDRDRGPGAGERWNRPGGGLRPDSDLRPGFGHRPENPGSRNDSSRRFDPDNRRPGGLPRTTPSVRPRLGEDGNRLPPGITQPDTPALRPPPVARPSPAPSIDGARRPGATATERLDRPRDRGRIESTDSSDRPSRRDWGNRRPDGQSGARDNGRQLGPPPAPTAPGTSTSSVTPAPRIREPRESSFDVRRRNFRSGGDAAASAPSPSPSVRPERRRDADSGTREFRPRRESTPSSALSSSQRPSSPPPRRSPPPPPPPPCAIKIVRVGQQRPETVRHSDLSPHFGSIGRRT